MPSKRGKYVINSKESISSVNQGGRVAKAKRIKTSTPVKTGLLRGYIRQSDRLRRNASPPTLSLKPLATSYEGQTEQYYRVDSVRLGSKKCYVMSSMPEYNSFSDNGHCSSKGTAGAAKLKRKDSKKDKKCGQKVDTESSFIGLRDTEKSTNIADRRSRSRKKTVGLFNCAGGQRSRSCTPERNATLSCRLPVSLDLESLDLQLAEIMAKQRHFSREYVSRQEPEERPTDKDCQSEHPKGSIFGGIRNFSFRRRKFVTKTASGRKQDKCDFPIDHAPKHHLDLGRDTVSTTSMDSGISSTENSMNRRGSGGLDSSSRPISSTAYCITSDSQIPPISAGVRMGTRRWDNRTDAAKGRPLSELFPLRDRPLPQPSLIRTNIINAPPKQDITLVKTLQLDKVLKHKWISGIAITRKSEYIIVDMREAYLLDEEGNLKRTIGSKGTGRLFEPISVSVMSNGNMLFSDHSEQDVKMYNSKGQFVGRVQDKGLINIAGVATNEKREIFIAGTDKGRVSVHNEGDQLLYTIPAEGQSKSVYEHPYSIAINPLTGDVLVGDDNKQLVTAVTCPEGKLLWKFNPVGNRHFFPSSICADENGYVFIADLYNEKVYMLDSGGKFIKTILSRGDGLKGGPGAIAVDGRGHLIVADEERTLKVFKYGENGFTMYRRTSQYCSAI